jgi:hypothetical protein
MGPSYRESGRCLGQGSEGSEVQHVLQQETSDIYAGWKNVN